MTSEDTSSKLPISNTNIMGSSKPKIKNRNFQITLNDHNGNLLNKYESIKNYLLNLKNISYFLAVREIGEKTQNDHIHIYAHFDKQSRLSINKLEGAHLEICFGLPRQNIGYLLKNFNQEIADSNFKEYKTEIEYYRQKKIEKGEENEKSTLLDEIGIRPHQGKKNYNYNDIINLNQEDILNNDELNLIQKKTILNIKKDIISNKPININDYYKNIKVYYICGPSGSGKTLKAIDIIKENNFDNFDEIKYANGFYIGASGLTKACLYDEFRCSHMSISEFINFIDYNKHNLNIKGGSIKNNYELIIITSIQNPYEIYDNVIDSEETREQILRRINIIVM